MFSSKGLKVKDCSFRLIDGNKGKGKDGDWSVFITHHQQSLRPVVSAFFSGLIVRQRSLTESAESKNANFIFRLMSTYEFITKMSAFP